MPQRDASGRRFRLLTAARLEEGLWHSASPPQKVLMILGACLLLCGCVWSSCIEDTWLLMQNRPLELSCDDAAARAPLVHLEGCDVNGGTVFTEGTAGLEELRFFRSCVPQVQGAWFKVNVERYTAATQEWQPQAKVGNLASVESVSEGLRIGVFLASKPLAGMIPGSDVMLQACNGSESEAGEFSARTMKAYGNAFYFGDPVFLSDGDVKVSFLVGDAGKASVLAAASDGVLRLPHAPLPGLHAWMGLPTLGVVSFGSVSAKAMQGTLGAELTVSRLWMLRGMGFVISWIGMSLLLFPNHVYPDFCGKLCYLRSAPGALVTTATCVGACYCFFHYPFFSSLAALACAPLLLATAAGANMKKCCWKLRQRSYVSEEDEPGVPFHVLESSGAVGGTLGRAARSAAFGIGLSLVVAGPAVQSFALVHVFGDVWDAVQQ